MSRTARSRSTNSSMWSAFGDMGKFFSQLPRERPVDVSTVRSLSILVNCSTDTAERRVSVTRLRARARPAIAVRSITAGAGRMILLANRAAMTPATIGCPRSVLQALCAAASIMRGRSAETASRIPKAAARMRAWSVIVCGRRAYSANAVAGISRWAAIQVTRASTGSSIFGSARPGWRSNASCTAKPSRLAAPRRLLTSSWSDRVKM